MKIFYSSVLLLLFFAGCTDKFDITEVNTSGNSNITGDTMYVQITPVWTGFNNPGDIYIGKEPFIYVADTDNDRIVMMNLDGRILGTRYVKRPVAISQDYKLNLIVCAEFDTVVNGNTITYSAVYKYNLYSSGHNIETAPVNRILPRLADLNFPLRKYTAVATFYNNSFYVARTGPGNTSLFDPDNSILVFHPKSLYGKGEGDSLIGRVPNINPVGSGLVSANQISAMTSFKNKSIDVILTLKGENSFKAQWFNYQVTAIDEKYVSKFYPSDGVSFAVPDKFETPEGCCIDDAGNIFIVDSGKDSVFKFNTFGEELHSFGGANVFKNPGAAAVFDKVLYIADSGNNRILRFILSTDLR